ncbi:MAG: DUF6011 domain-containing protein [Bacteroidia bacterium]
MISHKHSHSDSLLKHKLNNAEALAFMLGGKSTFTLKSLKTGKHFTYKVFNSKVFSNGSAVQNPDFKFVHLMTGSDNQISYTYMGFIKKQNSNWVFILDKGNKEKNRLAKLNENTPGVIAFNFVWDNLMIGREMPLLEFWSSGSCAVCGRLLTNEKSVELAMGPVCGPRNKKLMEELNAKINERKMQAVNKIVVQTQKKNPIQTKLFTTTEMNSKHKN